LPDRHSLTSKQLEAVKAAWNMGWYALPKRTRLDGLAKAFGISRAALHNRLAHSEAKIVEWFLAVHGELGLYAFCTDGAPHAWAPAGLYTVGCVRCSARAALVALPPEVAKLVRVPKAEEAPPVVGKKTRKCRRFGATDSPASEAVIHGRES
jgi:hypothetical protein